MDCKQGDIVLVNLNPKKGEEVGKLRPAVVVSDDAQNQELDVVIVVPLSSKLIDDAYPYRVRIEARKGLDHPSDALPYHIRAISKRRIRSIVAHITAQELVVLKNAICEVL